MKSRTTVTAAHFDAALLPRAPRHPLSMISEELSEDEVCELATESIGNTAQTVQALIEGVIQRHFDALDSAALAALNAVAYYHVPMLQDCVDDLGGGTGAH